MSKSNYSGFSKINKIIPQTARQYHLEAAYQKHSVMRYWEEALAAFVSKSEGQTKAMDFKKGTLYVACLSSRLADEIRSLADRILYALNQLLGRTMVYALEIEI